MYGERVIKGQKIMSDWVNELKSNCVIEIKKEKTNFYKTTNNSLLLFKYSGEFFDISFALARIG